MNPFERFGIKTDGTEFKTIVCNPLSLRGIQKKIPYHRRMRGGDPTYQGKKWYGNHVISVDMAWKLGQYQYICSTFMFIIT